MALRLDDVIEATAFIAAPAGRHQATAHEPVLTARYLYEHMFDVFGSPGQTQQGANQWT